MLGVKSGVAIRIKEKCPMAVDNQCFCHSSHLSSQNVYKDVIVLKNFKDQAQEMMNLVKKSPARETALENLKKNAPSYKINEIPSSVGKVLKWSFTRFVENKNTLHSLKLNYDYMYKVFMSHSDPKVTSDSEMRGRLIAACKNLESFKFMFLLYLSVDFLGILDNMNKTMQDPSKCLSALMFMVEKCIETLESSRTDNYWDMFYKLCHMYGTKYDSVDMENMDFSPRRRQRHNYKELHNYFQLEGLEIDETEPYLRAIKNNVNVLVTIKVGGEIQCYDKKGTKYVAN